MPILHEFKKVGPTVASAIKPDHPLNYWTTLTAEVEHVCLSYFSSSWDKMPWAKRLKGEVGFVAHSLRLQSVMLGSHSTGHTRELHPQSRSRDWQICVLGSLSLLYVCSSGFQPREGLYPAFPFQEINYENLPEANNDSMDTPGLSNFTPRSEHLLKRYEQKCSQANHS